MKYLILIVTVCGFIACNSETKAPVENAAETTAKVSEAPATATDAAKMLIGKWQSVEDAKSVVEIAEATITDTYDGKKTPARKFAYFPDCSNVACAGAKGAMGCYTSAGEVDIECFNVVKVDATVLETSMAGGRGNTNHYKRMK